MDNVNDTEFMKCINFQSYSEMWCQEALYLQQCVMYTYACMHAHTHADTHAHTHTHTYTHKLSVDHQLHNGYFTTVGMVSGVAFHRYLLKPFIRIHIAYYVINLFFFMSVCSCMCICVSLYANLYTCILNVFTI